MLKVSERRACRALGQHRSTQREEDGAKAMLPVLRQALMTAGRLLARNMASPDPSERFH